MYCCACIIKNVYVQCVCLPVAVVFLKWTLSKDFISFKLCLLILTNINKKKKSYFINRQILFGKISGNGSMTQLTIPWRVFLKFNCDYKLTNFVFFFFLVKKIKIKISFQYRSARTEWNLKKKKKNFTKTCIEANSTCSYLLFNRWKTRINKRLNVQLGTICEY